MKIAVRLDDITPDMDWERFWKFKALLDQYQVKPLLGVVPDNQDENLVLQSGGEQDFWSVIKQLKEDGWVIAMHGCHHIYGTAKGGLFPLNNFSEFAGIPYEKQKEMLAYGKSILEKNGITTDIFMAPAHSYDTNTLKALRETGFQAVTDGFGDAPYLWKEITFYPISFQFSRTLRKSTGYSTMVVHTNTLSDKDLKRYEGYFRMPGNEWISYQEYLRVPPRKRGRFMQYREFFLAKGKYLMGRLRR